MLFIYVACLQMCVLFYFYFVCLRVCAYALKSKVCCGCALGPGASRLLYYCTPLVCVPDVIGALAVWRHDTHQKKINQIQYKNNYYFGCVFLIHVACHGDLWMCVLFYFYFVCLHVGAYVFKFKVHCGSTLGPGASGLPYYCTPPVFLM